MKASSKVRRVSQPQRGPISRPNDIKAGILENGHMTDLAVLLS
jgi:hypothetical protein